MAKQLLTIEQVCELVGVSDDTIRRAIAGGKLTATKPGRDYKIAPDHLNEWLAARSNKPTKAIYCVTR